MDFSWPLHLSSYTPAPVGLYWGCSQLCLHSPAHLENHQRPAWAGSFSRSLSPCMLYRPQLSREAANLVSMGWMHPETFLASSGESWQTQTPEGPRSICWHHRGLQRDPVAKPQEGVGWFYNKERFLELGKFSSSST